MMDRYAKTLIRCIIAFLIYWTAFALAGPLTLLVMLLIVNLGLEVWLQSQRVAGKVVMGQVIRGKWTLRYGNRESVRELLASLVMKEHLDSGLFGPRYGSTPEEVQRLLDETR